MIKSKRIKLIENLNKVIEIESFINQYKLYEIVLYNKI